MAGSLSACRAKALRDYREKHSLVREEIGRWAGIGGVTLYRYETGRSPIPRYVFHLYRYYVQQRRKGWEKAKGGIE
jgi:hypothetical protein